MRPRHHGVRAVGALWGYGSRTELEAAGAQAFCESPRHLAAALLDAARPALADQAKAAESSATP